MLPLTANHICSASSFSFHQSHSAFRSFTQYKLFLCCRLLRQSSISFTIYFSQISHVSFKREAIRESKFETVFVSHFGRTRAQLSLGAEIAVNLIVHVSDRYDTTRSETVRNGGADGGVRLRRTLRNEDLRCSKDSYQVVISSLKFFDRLQGVLYSSHLLQMTESCKHETIRKPVVSIPETRAQYESSVVPKALRRVLAPQLTVLASEVAKRRVKTSSELLAVPSMKTCTAEWFHLFL